MIDEALLQRIDVTTAQMGATITATPRGIADSGADSTDLVVSGEALRPPSPVHLTALIDGAGDLQCQWCRRSRLGWAWVDGVDAPLGASAELYRIRLQGSVSAIDVETSAPEANFTAAQVASAGGGALTLAVVQVGDFAVSRAAILNII